MSTRQTRLHHAGLIDTTPLPESIPPVTECGTSSAPLLSASFFIGDRCRAYNDDYMQCKTEGKGRGELDCMREGRKVTRCAKSVIDDLNKNCLEQFRKHWQCLDDNNQQLWNCRNQEQILNVCAFEKLNMKKTIPGSPANEIPVHMRPKQIFAESMLFSPSPRRNPMISPAREGYPELVKDLPPPPRSRRAIERETKKVEVSHSQSQPQSQSQGMSTSAAS